MLPTSSSSPAGRRQHRRQNSTPSAAHAAERFSPYPSTQQRRQALSHRRGMSLDLRQLQTTADGQQTNNTNQAGLASIPQHHVLREAQQHSPKARPGPGSQATFSNTNHSIHNQQQLVNNISNSSQQTNKMAEGGYLVSPHGTPQPHSYDPSCFDPSASFDSFTDGNVSLSINVDANTNALLHNSQLSLGPSVADNHNFQLFDQSSALSSQMLNFTDLSSAQTWSPQANSDNNVASPAAPAASQKPAGRRISGGIADQVSKYERMGLGATHRASTPPIQTYNSMHHPPPPFFESSFLFCKSPGLSLLSGQFEN